MSETVVLWRKISNVIESECTCGGKPPDEEGICLACVIFHRLKKHAVYITPKLVLDTKLTTRAAEGQDFDL